MLAFLSYICLFHSSIAAEAPCISKPVGANVIIPISYKGLKDTDHLKWVHGNDRVYNRKGDRIYGKHKIESDGSLKIDNIKLSDSGEYEVWVYSSSGTLLHSSSKNLCVIVSDPLKKPEVKYICAGQWPVLKCELGGSTDVNVNWNRNGQATGQSDPTLTVNSNLFKAGDGYSCTVKNQVSEEVKPVCSGIQEKKPILTLKCDKVMVNMTCSGSTGMVFSWKRNDKKINNQNKAVLSLRRAKLEHNDTFSCAVENGTHEIQSENVQLFCKDQSTNLPFELWIMVVILAGGGLVVLLIIISIVCCLCKRKRTKEKEMELRLANLPNTSDDHQQSDQTPLKRPRRERGPLPEIPKPRVRPAQLLSNSGNKDPDMVINGQYMHMG